MRSWSGSMKSSTASAYDWWEAVNTITSNFWFTVSRHSKAYGRTFIPASTSSPSIGTFMMNWGFSVSMSSTQCIKVSSISKISVFLYPVCSSGGRLTILPSSALTCGISMVFRYCRACKLCNMCTL